jgi:hypothetical protein
MCCTFWPKLELNGGVLKVGLQRMFLLRLTEGWCTAYFWLCMFLPIMHSATSTCIWCNPYASLTREVSQQIIWGQVCQSSVHTPVPGLSSCANILPYQDAATSKLTTKRSFQGHSQSEAFGTWGDVLSETGVYLKAGVGLIPIYSFLANWYFPILLPHDCVRHCAVVP